MDKRNGDRGFEPVQGVHPLSHRLFEEPKAGWRPIANIAIGFALGFAGVMAFVWLFIQSRGG